MQARSGCRDAAPHLVHHFEDVPRAPTARRQPGDDVAAVLRRGEQPQLGAGAPRRALDLGGPGQHVLGDADLAVRLDERGAPRREVIEDERALVHLRQKAGPQESEQAHPHGHEHRRREADAPWMIEDARERPLVARAQRVEPLLHPGEQPRPRRLHLVRRDELLGEQRDDGEREAQ